MMPICDSRAMLMPVNSGMLGASPAMVPMMPMVGTPMVCAPNNMNMFSTTSLMSEYDSKMYGRFRHVEREHPRYRHAPFDWYRPPKQCYNVVHEDAAVVTLDGPVPIGDFYRHYIYGDETDDDYDDDDYYDDDSSSFTSDEYDDVDGPSYEPRSAGYRRNPRADFDDDDDDDIGPPRRPVRGSGNYSSLNTSRPGTNPIRPPLRGTRTLAGDDDFDDAASQNSTYGN